MNAALYVLEGKFIELKHEIERINHSMGVLNERLKAAQTTQEDYSQAIQKIKENI